jgi:hypothetical protein
MPFYHCECLCVHHTCSRSLALRRLEPVPAAAAAAAAADSKVLLLRSSMNLNPVQVHL